MTFQLARGLHGVSSYLQCHIPQKPIEAPIFLERLPQSQQLDITSAFLRFNLVRPILAENHCTQIKQVVLLLK